MRRLLLRWTWRDLRARWPVVVAISLVVAFGVGVFAALNSTTAWRRNSNDASFALTRMHDVRIQLTQAAYVPQGSLAQVVAGSGAAASVIALEERLILPTQVALETSTGAVYLPGDLVGSGTGSALSVDAVWLSKGRPVDPNAPVPEAILEYKIANDRDLPAEGTLRLSGGGELRYVGTGTSPEYFLLTSGGGGEFLASRSFVPVYTTLATAQQVTGHTGTVNDAALRLAPGTNVAGAITSINAAFSAAMPDLAVTVSDREATESYRKLYDDVETDQRLWNIISALTLASASFAAFNLVTRMVESQRREIGIAMALGMRRGAIARRPLMVACQIVVLGGIAGLLVGWLIGLIIASLIRSLAPLPVWSTSLQFDVYVQALLVGITVPLLATTYPVVRAVRMQPVDALTTGHRAAPIRALAHVPHPSPRAEPRPDAAPEPAAQPQAHRAHRVRDRGRHLRARRDLRHARQLPAPRRSR
jgi:putative ABC transport system permease protein